MHIRMGTRGSALALAQCNEVKALLEKAYPQHSFEICVITTKGDRIQHVALDQMKDKGIFVKEIEQQLLEHTIDLAVHSMKDFKRYGCRTGNAGKTDEHRQNLSAYGKAAND